MQATMQPGATQAATQDTTPNPAPNPAQDAAGATKPSELVQPALATLQQTLTALKLDKWKSGSIREEAATNISSIQKDLEGPLAQLLDAADAAPASAAKTLPAYRNMDALYDVLIRVEAGARVSAPGEQVGQLQEARATVDKARRALGDQLADLTTAQEKQVASLQASLKTQAAPACPAVAPAPASAPPTAAKKKKKPATAPTPKPQN